MKFSFSHFPTFSLSHFLVFPSSRLLVFLVAVTLLITQAHAQVINIPDPKLRDAITETLELPAGQPITQQEMRQLTRLEATNIGIINLTGLKYATNLESLDLEGNQIDDISPLTELIQLTSLSLWRNRIQDITPLAKLTQLEFINLTGNSIQDITILANLTQLLELHLVENQIRDIRPLANLVRLEKLWLEHNMITDITPLANLIQLQFLQLTDNSIQDITILANLTQLLELSVAANQIRDIRPLANLVRLEKLWLNTNAITDITPLIGLINLKVLHLADNPIHDFTPFAEFEGVELDVEIDLSQLDELSIVVEIPDPNLAQAIREALPLSDAILLTRGIMLRLTTLEAINRAITDLTGLQYATNLTELNAADNQIRDMRPLATLTQLEGLILFNNQVQDITPLANLTNLSHLNLGMNRVENLEPLAGLMHLQTLDVGTNRVKDIAPIANLTSLKVLILNGNPVSDLTPLANHPNLEELDIRGTLVTDLSPLNRLNLILGYNEVCDIPPLLPPVRERIENRTFPSVYQPWGDILDLDNPTRPWDSKWSERAAKHDLSWGPFFWLTSNWGINVTQRIPNWGLSTSLSTENASQVRQEFLAQNPNHVFLTQVLLHRHNDPEAFPPDSDFWLRDASGQIVQDGNEYLINFLKIEVQDLLAKRILAVERCGFYDGVFLDNFFMNATLHRSYFPAATEEDIITAHQNILRSVRSQALDDFLIIVNASWSKPTAYAEFINGTWMEIGLPMYTDLPNDNDDPYFRLRQYEEVLAWAERNLRPPQITCHQGRSFPDEPPDSPRNRRWMRTLTTMNLTHSDGYVVYSTATSHDHLWFSFWDADLGRPIGAKAETYANIDGLFIREFTNGWAVYNRSGTPQTITLPVPATPVSDREDNGASMNHPLPNFDGEIYLKAPNPADVNGDGQVNILDLVHLANNFGKSDPDLNGDGQVNILDLTRVAQQFSQ